MCLAGKAEQQHTASNFKGTKVHAFTACDWLIKALFALSGIPIALSQVIEMKRRSVSVKPKKDSTQLKAVGGWKEHQSLLLFCSTHINIEFMPKCVQIILRCSQSISVVHRTSSDRKKGRKFKSCALVGMRDNKTITLSQPHQQLHNPAWAQ